MSSPSKLGLSARDGEMLYHAIKSLEPKVKFDWSQVATAMGFKNRSVASTRFYQVMKRLESSGKNNSDGSLAIGTAKGKKRKASDSQESVGDASPSACLKRARKTPKQAAAPQDPVIKQERNDQAAPEGNLNNGEGDLGMEPKVDKAEKSDGEDTVVEDMDAED